MLGTVRKAVFLVSLPFGILEFVLPIYGVQIGADAVQIGLFFTVFFLMTVLLRPLVGVALDRWGRKPFFIAGIGGYALTMAAFAYSDQVWGVLIARTVQGIASSLLWLSAQAITADVSGDESRGRAFGGVSQSGSQGAILGTFIGFVVLMSLGIQAGWKPLFLGYGLVSALTALLTWRNLKESNPARREEKPSPIPWSRPWVLLLLVAAVTGAAWAMLAPVMMIYLQQKFNAGMTDLGRAYLPAALIWAMLPSRLGSLADRFGRKPLMVLGMASAAATSFFIPGLGSLAALAVLWAVQALCYAAGDPAEQALVADLTGGDQRGRAYGLYAMAAGLGAAVGPLAGGWLYENISQQAPFYANGVILAICTMVLGLFLQEPRRSEIATERPDKEAAS